jgi:hypothetical protein
MLGAGKISQVCSRFFYIKVRESIDSSRRGWGAMQNDSERQLLQLAKWITLAAILLTSICMAAVVGLQVASGMAGEAWTLLSVREIVERAAQPDQQDVTAGIGFRASPVLEWVLDLPATLLLGSALGVLVVYYRYLRSLELP